MTLDAFDKLHTAMMQAHGRYLKMIANTLNFQITTQTRPAITSNLIILIDEQQYRASEWRCEAIAGGWVALHKLDRDLDIADLIAVIEMTS